tara:strand:- start:192 stop:587 length:396 start_codon:yes stop_codon:yes gene_type:complete
MECYNFTNIGGAKSFSKILDEYKKSKAKSKSKNRTKSKPKSKSNSNFKDVVNNISKTKKKERKKPTYKNKQKTLRRKNKMCKCSLNKISQSPEGLGFCAKCNKLEVVIKGKNNKLWENKLIDNKNTWVQIN